ncbi:MAG: hypothetical protein JWQ24_3104 [Tardiphaga sp.]|nr:hypothetical protein [Tardiphaga sp.]
MQDEPTPIELTRAVADFLRADIAPQITGHTAFKLRVAINALDLVTRQLSLQGDSDTAELHGLTMLLGVQGTLKGLNADLAERIAQGDVDLSVPGVKDHLWQTTLAKLAIDQPNYAAYKRELEADLSTTSPSSFEARPSGRAPQDDDIGACGATSPSSSAHAFPRTP